MIVLLVFSQIQNKIIYGFIKQKKWLTERCEREWIHYKKMLKNVGIHMTKEDFMITRKEQWPDWVMMISMHFIGFLLCVPAIFGYFDRRLAVALACYSSIMEMSYEW